MAIKCTTVILIIIFLFFNFPPLDDGVVPVVGSSRKRIDGLATSSTAIVKRFISSNDKPLPFIPTTQSRMGPKSNNEMTCSMMMFWSAVDVFLWEGQGLVADIQFSFFSFASRRASGPWQSKPS